MTIREASFGDLFKIGFWIQLGPALIALAMTGVMLSATVFIVPDIPAQLAQLGLIHLPGAEAGGGVLPAVGAIWAFVLGYAAMTTLFATLRSLSGAVLLVGWRKTFKPKAPETAARPAIVPAE